MPSYNKILSKIPIGELTKGGQKITLSAATKTSAFARPENVAQAQGPGFKKAVEASSELIPEGTVEVCQRDTKHQSAEDLRDHYTGVCFDEQGDGTSVHFPETPLKKQ